MMMMMMMICIRMYGILPYEKIDRSAPRRRCCNIAT